MDRRTEAERSLLADGRQLFHKVIGGTVARLDRVTYVTTVPDYHSRPKVQVLDSGLRITTWLKQPLKQESCRWRSWRSSNTFQRRSG